MNKRMDAFRSLINATSQPEMLSADNKPAKTLSADNKPASSPRVSAGAVRSMKDSFSGVERENEELRERLASAIIVQVIDPALIDPSPVKDRFGEPNDPGFETLKASISQRGQEVPVLLRPHPTDAGRFQTAYGHRRVRAARDLGIQVRAVVKELTNEDLVLAQGIENSAREDLSFIERAVFAARLEDAGYDRSVIQDALSVDRAEASKLVSVAKAIPEDIVSAIGRAPKIGRPRWLALGEALKEKRGAAKAARATIEKPEFEALDSDNRFLKIFTAVTVTPKEEGRKPAARTVHASSGEKIARVSHSGRDLKISVDQTLDESFAAFLVDQLPELFETFKEKNG